MEKLVKIKFLKNCMQWNEGTEVDLPEAQAKDICQVRTRQIGEGKVESFQIAMPIEEIERLKNLPMELGGLSLDEARALGIKNVVSPPKDDPYSPFFKEEQVSKKQDGPYFEDGKKGKKK